MCQFNSLPTEYSTLNFACFLSFAEFLKINCFEKFFEEITIRVSNSFDPDQARQNVWPELGPTVYKGYQQMTLVGNKLNHFFLDTQCLT